jgi:moderate conductance mechanosensitive channel
MKSFKHCKTIRIAALVVTLLLFSLVAWAQHPGRVKGKPSSGQEQPQSQAEITPEQIDSQLATMNDEQVRRVLAEKLKQEAAASSHTTEGKVGAGREVSLGPLFFQAEQALSSLYKRLSVILGGAETEAGNWPVLWFRLTGGKGVRQFLLTLTFLAGIVLGGLTAEKLVLRATTGIRDALLKATPLGKLEKVGLILSRLFLDAVGVAVYVLVTFLLFVAVYDRGDPGYLIVSHTLIASYYFRLIMLGARILISPKAHSLRLVPLADSDAEFSYRWLVLVAAFCLPTAVVSTIIRRAGGGAELSMLVYSCAAPIMSLLLIIMICEGRRRVAEAICPATDHGAGPTWSPRARCAGLWHYLAIVYVIGIGAFWWGKVMMRADVTILNLILSLFLIPLCIGLDHWVQKMLTMASGESREIIDLTPSDTTVELDSGRSKDMPYTGFRQATRGKDVRLYLPLIRKAFRVVLIIFLFFTMLHMWGIEFDLGWVLARSVLSIIIVIVLALIVWELVRVRIDQKLKEEMPLQGEDLDEGGEGGSRSATLLLLLRKCILVVLFVIISFIILASLGVNIGPLLAGAGVVGLAIGFGAQTLVKDIISGIFFLIDDAFRVGDYVEAGTAKGTVEQISLRSLTLRHPRGQLFTIPFGDLKMVTNFSRDYAITKLDIRIRFDSDLDKIRKIIKKINKEMMQDEEIRKVMLSGIKSQGVRQMDDSAMILRVKYKTLPGEQFVVRRELYHRIQKAFREKGIEFAHRNVTVYLPPEVKPSEGGEPGHTGKRVIEAGAAAAAAIAQAEEEAAAATKKKEEK